MTSAEKNRKDWTKTKRKTDEDELRSKDVAHILDCSPDDVIELARKGKLEARKHGRFWRFTLSDVKEYQKKQEA